MNRAIWIKSISDAWRQLAVSCLLLVLFSLVFVWLTSLFQADALVAILNLLPKFVEPMVGVPLADLATPVGRLSVLYVHIITQLVCLTWAVGRASDMVSGEISRGTMDLILTLPIRRATLILASAVVTAAGGVVLAMTVWIGTWLGVLLVDLKGPVAMGQLMPGAVNLAAMTFFLAGFTSVLSASDHSRWRVILTAAGFYTVSAILQMVSRLWEHGTWLRYLTFFTAFSPQQLILLPAEVTRPLAWWYNGTLIALGLAGYALAAAIFTYRDIPGR